MSKFENIPNEIFLKIFYDQCLSLEDIISLSYVCKRFQDICCSEEKYWKSKFRERWPLAWTKINSEKRKSTCNRNWKNNVEKSMNVRNEIEEILSTISHHSYQCKSIPSTVLSSVYKLLDGEKFIPFIILEELSREKTNLTHRYYANELFYHVKYYISSKEIKEFFDLPPEKQTLEKGVYYVVKEIQPEYFPETDYDELSIKLDNLALEVQSSLRHKNSNHPAASIKLFSPEDPLQNSKWSEEENLELIECLNYILCSKYLGNYDIQNIILHDNRGTFLENKKYFSIVYIAVSHRLGLRLQPIFHSGSFLIIWNPSHSENFEALHPFPNLEFHDFKPTRDFVLRSGTSSTKIVMFYLACSWLNTRIFGSTNNRFPDNIPTLGIILLLQFYLGKCSGFTCSVVFRMCLEYELFLKDITEITWKLDFEITPIDKFFLGERFTIDNIDFFNLRAEDLLEGQRKGPKAIMAKNRMEVHDIKFAIGMIVTWKLNQNPGVLLGWDKRCYPDFSLNNEYGSSFFNNRFGQTFYKVLFPDGEPQYIPQEILCLEEVPVPIMHFEIGKYFKKFNGTFYEPNKELCSEYPDDDAVRNKLYIENRSELRILKERLMIIE